jgi:exosortase E/protease (VPEID-CTERM system)
LAFFFDTPRHINTNSKSWLVSRTALLLLVLFAEILAFSLIYDLQPLQKNASYSLRVVGHCTSIFRVIVIALVARMAIGRERLPATFRRWIALSSNDRTFGWMFAGHVVAASFCALLTSHALRPSSSDGSPWAVWLWLATGGLSLAFWLVAFAPVEFWRELWRSRKPSLLILSLLFGLAVHFLALFASRLWYPLSDLTMAASERLLRLVSSDIVCDPATRALGTRTFQIEIAPVCSGYEGIGLVTGALVLFLVLFRKQLRFPHAFVLLPIGIAAIWCFNVLRIVALILMGTHISEAIAAGGFHSQAGWIGFAAVTLVIGYIALRSPLLAKVDPRGRRGNLEAAESRAAAYLMPTLAMLVAAMIAAALSAGFDAFYPLKVLVGLALLAYFSPVYRSFEWSWSWLAAANGVLVFVIWLLLEPLANIGDSQLVDGLAKLSPHWMAVWTALRVFGAVSVVPLTEELAFRGYLMRRITAVDFEAIDYRQASWLAVFVSSLLFGLLHGRWLAGTVAGICYALAARRRGLLCDAVVAHGVTNGMIAIYVLLTGAWQLWS